MSNGSICLCHFSIYSSVQGFVVLLGEQTPRWCWQRPRPCHSKQNISEGAKLYGAVGKILPRTLSQFEKYGWVGRYKSPRRQFFLPAQ